MKSHIILKGLQIKNIKTAKKLAKSLQVIEEECGIKHVRISIEDIFICSWIDLEQLNETRMEIFLKDLIQK